MGADITTLPKATGQIRDIQLANLAILEEIDYVCRQENIKYWLDYGTLLGAVRHKGYIPWDDDIDISMLREDFEHFISCFNEKTRNKDLYLKHHTFRHGGYMLKVCHKKCKHLFVDVFIYDFCPKGMSNDEKIKYTEHLQELRKDFLKNAALARGLESYREFKTLRDKIQQDVGKDINNTDLMYGIEFGHRPYVRNNYVMPFSDIFPLKEIEFEGKKFFSVNKPDDHLIEVFGNYMGYPSKLDFGHSAYVVLSKEDKAVIKSLIDGLN